MNQENIYQRPVTWWSICRLTIPTVCMTLIQSSYSMIDGMFVSNMLGADALSSLTIITPIFQLLIAVGAMFASGGSAVVMKKMGSGLAKEARQDFSFLVLLAVCIGFACSTLLLLFAQPLVNIFKAQPHMTEFCRQYLFTYGFFAVPQVLFSVLQMFTIASGRAKLAMISSFIGGAVNILFDFLMIQVFALGMTGAALASGLGMLVPCIILLMCLTGKRNFLHFTKPRFSSKVFIQTLTNGSSEFASNLVSGVVIMLFNGVMMLMAGPSGIAASTITFYVFGLMSALYMGYMLGISPLLSYYHGASEKDKLKKIRNISLLLIGIVAVSTTILSILGSEALVSAFVKQTSKAYNLAISGNRLFSIALLLVGFNTFSSMLFTALSNGKISAVIAFSRTFVFLVAAILVFPMLWGINGLWLAVPISELLALLLSGWFLKKYQKQYGY